MIFTYDTRTMHLVHLPTDENLIITTSLDQYINKLLLKLGYIKASLKVSRAKTMYAYKFTLIRYNKVAVVYISPNKEDNVYNTVIKNEPNYAFSFCYEGLKDLLGFEFKNKITIYVKITKIK